MKFASKAETLSSLQGKLQYGQVLPQLHFSVDEWNNSNGELDIFSDRPEWLSAPVIVRSSGIAEDTNNGSLAGHFDSVANVCGEVAIKEAISTVINSFHNHHGKDQVFIQPMLTAVTVSGVAFTRDPNNGGHYDVINYDDRGGSTDTVTAGSSGDLHIHYSAKSKPPVSGWLAQLVSLLRELEKAFDHDALDVEFAVHEDGNLYLLQVRPLIMKIDSCLDSEEQHSVLERIDARCDALSKPHPYLFGNRSMFGIMPDWNPAEIIGIRPRPLALSLYKELVTDNIWAYQRDNYGYRNLRSFPLLVNFAGLPYIDVRVSFNSFVPEDVEEKLAERLINYYLDRLVANPKFHDKVEFEVIFSCYTFDLPERITLLEEHGFDSEDTASLTDSLRRLTQGIIDNKEGLWIRDTAKLHELQKRQNTILSSDLLTIEKIYWLVEDCKRYGTLPFAGLARAGFIAVQMLKSLVAVGIFSDDDYDGFMRTLNTVSSTMSCDLRSLSRGSFLQKYGHLRPGTYNILSPRYDEAPDRYFDWKAIEEAPQPKEMSDFKLGLKTLNRLEKLLAEHEFDGDVLGLFHFIQGAIEGREYAKFIFSKSLSDVISLIGELGHSMGLDKEEMSYTNIREILDLYSTSEDLPRRLQRVIDQGKHGHEVVKSISLPPLITRAEDVWNFELPQNEPNFITQGKVVGVVVNEHTDRDRLKNAILMIPSADPGYDWIFSHAIGGFITQYGGANSHMAIRAGELGIPAIVGAGEIFYQQWGKARILDVDCGNRQVQILQ